MDLCGILAVLGITASVSVAILGVLIARRTVQVRWWAIPVIILSAAVSCTGLVVEKWFREPVLSALKPALWIEKSWDSLCFWLVFLWLVGTAIVIWRGGVRLTRRRLILPVAVAYLGVMLPATAVNAGVLHFEMICRSGGPVIRLPAQAVSPDGQWRAYCALVQRKVVIPLLAVETDRWFNVSRKTAGVDRTSALPDEAAYRIVWSRDSQIASVWCGDLALSAYNVVTGTGEEGGGRREPQELSKAVQALLDAHGGPAP